MVLHPAGCGRVTRRRITRWGFPSSRRSGKPPSLYPIPDGIPLDGAGRPGKILFTFSCRRSSGSSAAFIKTRSDMLSRGLSRNSTSARPQNQCLAIGYLLTVVPVTSLFSYLRRKSTSDAFSLMLGIVGRLKACIRWISHVRGYGLSGCGYLQDACTGRASPCLICAMPKLPASRIVLLDCSLSTRRDTPILRLRQCVVS